MENPDIAQIRNFRRLGQATATGGQPTQHQLALLAHSGVEVVINLGLANAEYSLADEKGDVESLGLTYVHIPVLFQERTSADLDQFIETLSRHHDRTLFIHCAQNKRVSAFMALYRILHLGWPRDRAMADLYQVWRPDTVWRRFIAAEIARRSTHHRVGPLLRQ